MTINKYGMITNKYGMIIHIYGMMINRYGMIISKYGVILNKSGMIIIRVLFFKWPWESSYLPIFACSCVMLLSHVHRLLTINHKQDARMFLFLSTLGHFSLLPLIFTEAGMFIIVIMKYCC